MSLQNQQRWLTTEYSYLRKDGERLDGINVSEEAETLRVGLHQRRDGRASDDSRRLPIRLRQYRVLREQNHQPVVKMKRMTKRAHK